MQNAYIWDGLFLILLEYLIFLLFIFFGNENLCFVHIMFVLFLEMVDVVKKDFKLIMLNWEVWNVPSSFHSFSWIFIFTLLIISWTMRLYASRVGVSLEVTWCSAKCFHGQNIRWQISKKPTHLSCFSKFQSMTIVRI